MKLVGSSGQQIRHFLYRADGAIVAGGAPQLVMGRAQSRSYLKLQNLSNEPLWFEFGSGQATATIASGAVSAVSVTNVGFGFSRPPVIIFMGGGGKDGPLGNTSYLGLGQPGAPAPSNFAQAHCVMTGAAPNQVISSVVIDNPGANYLCAPYVHIYNDDLDPNGCAAPSAGVGMMLAPQGPPFILNGTACTTDPIAVYGATTGSKYLARWMD